MKKIIYFFSLILLFSCEEKSGENLQIKTFQGISFLKDSLFSKQIDEVKDSKRIKKYKDALNDLKKDNNWENTIWVGRRIAYLGDYRKAIDYFSKGHLKYPNKAEFLRHRGHRYISIRKIDNAIEDLLNASKLIAGKKDVIEQDGIPNALNIPISSLHSNIYYHLGLAYYIKGDLENSLTYYLKNLEISNNDDNIVSTSHWLYMIYRRLNLPEKAEKILEPISENMNIIENKSYYDLLLFYKGIKAEEELLNVKSGMSGSSEAVIYGVGNWYYYNGNKDKALTYFNELLENGNWAGFGYISAEADLSRMKP